MTTVHESRYTRWLATIILSLTVVACALAPKGPREYYAATYTAIEAAANALPPLAEAGKLTPDEALRNLDKLGKAKQLTDEARRILVCRQPIDKTVEADAKCGLAKGAASREDSARELLNQVQAVIRQKR